jgi:hypothetical protein
MPLPVGETRVSEREMAEERTRSVVTGEGQEPKGRGEGDMVEAVFGAGKVQLVEVDRGLLAQPALV